MESIICPRCGKSVEYLRKLKFEIDVKMEDHVTVCETCLTKIMAFAKSDIMEY